MARKCVCIKKIIPLTVHQTCIDTFLQHEYLYSFNSYLKFVYSRKHWEYLYLIPHVSCF